MSKITKGLLITAFSVLTVSLIFSTLYTYSVSEELSLLRREGRSDLVYLRSRIRDLESELSAQQADTDVSVTIPVGGDDPADGPADGPANGSTNGTDGTDTDREASTSTPAEETEEVTIPTHSSPETSPPADTEASAAPLPASPYLVAAHDGVIGIFDATGALLKTANVYIMTLPESDRSTLEVGIPAGSWAEALRLLDMYE